MLGTVVNTGAIIVGSCIGAVINRGIKDSYKTIVLQSVGLICLALGTTWFVKNISASTKPILFVFSLVVGGNSR